MRVAIPLAGTDRGRSGIGTWVRQVIPRLAARVRGEGGSVVALGTGSDLAAYAPILEGIGVVRMPSAFDRPGPSALMHLLAGSTVASANGADLVLWPAANRRATAANGIPGIGVVHDVAQLHVAGKYDALRTAYLRHVLLPVLRRTRALVAVSATTRDELASALDLDPAGIAVVPNGVDAERFAAAARDGSAQRVRTERGFSDPYLLYVSRLEHPGKNHLGLLRGFARSEARHTHRLVLAGPDWGALARVRAAIDQLGLHHRVHLLGFVDDGDLPGLVAGADAVAMVGLHEGFGLPVLEALAAGRPVVVARAGALPEVAGDLGAYCDPHDADSIAAAVDEAVSSSTLRARVASEGPVRAAERSWDRTAEGLLAVCRRLLS